MLLRNVTCGAEFRDNPISAGGPILSRHSYTDRTDATRHFLRLFSTLQVEISQGLETHEACFEQ